MVIIRDSLMVQSRVVNAAFYSFFFQHPFIVDCHMSVQTDKQLFFISEYIQVT
jgi:hypothetical protein